MKRWVVVGGAGNGIIVRIEVGTSSRQEPDRLATGAVVEEQERSGTRMRYRKVSGLGPQAGWVSISASGQDLLVPMIASVGGQAADALTKVVSGSVGAEEAMAIFNSISNKNDKAAGILLAGIPDMFLKERNPVAALAAAREAVEFFDRKGDKVGLASAYVAVGSAQLAQELNGDALESANQARSIFKEMGDAGGEASVLEIIVRILLASNSSAEALKATTEMVSLGRKGKDSKATGTLLLHASEVFLQCGRSVEASAAASDAGQIFRGFGNKREEAESLLAVAYAEMNTEYGQAVSSAQAAADMFRELGDIDAQASALYTVASAYLGQLAVKQRTCVFPSKADTEGVITAAREAHTLFGQVNNREGQALAMQALQRVLTVNSLESDMILNDTTDNIMSKTGKVMYGVKPDQGKTIFQQSKFAWREPTAGYHYTLVWDQQVQGNGQNQRSGYKTVMAAKAARSAALPMYHALKSSFNRASGNEGPLMIHMNAMNSSWEYGTSLVSNVSTVSAMLSCKLNHLVFIQVNECPADSADAMGKVRQVYMSPVTLSVLRSARLEAPQMTIGYLALDTATWHSNRAEVIAALPDVMQSEESEMHFYKGTPLAPTLIQKAQDPSVQTNVRRTI